jgi:hypothetical protein
MGEFSKMIGSAFLGALIALYLPFFRRLIWGPKLSLFFDKNIDGCIAKTPIELIMTNGERIETEGYYIRVMVKNEKYLLARDCRAFLVNIEKKEEDNKFHSTVYYDSIQAQWACRSGQGFSGIDLPRGLNQFIDVIGTIKDNPNIDLKIDSKIFLHRPLLSEIGTFRYTIQVSGNELNPVKIKFIFKWNGKWDDFDVDIDRESCLTTERRRLIFDIISKMPLITRCLRFLGINMPFADETPDSNKIKD